MHVGPTFIAHAQPAKLVQPGERALDHPARQAKMAAVPGEAFADLRTDATLSQDAPIRFTVVAAVGLNALRFAQRPSAPTGNGRQALQQWHELGRVMPIRARENHIQRRACGVDEEMMFAARLAPISRVGTCFFPPCTARTDELSAITREKSIRSALRSLARSTRCSLLQTPAFCQSRARRQQVMPEPQPISWGSSSQGKPDCRMNTMPVNTRRSSSRLRPAGVLCGGGGGSKGRTISHKSSSTSSRAMSSLHRNCRKDDWTAIIRFC
jgi:hypothetical protein